MDHLVGRWKAQRCAGFSSRPRLVCVCGDALLPDLSFARVVFNPGLCVEYHPRAATPDLSTGYSIYTYGIGSICLFSQPNYSRRRVIWYEQKCGRRSLTSLGTIHRVRCIKHRDGGLLLHQVGCLRDPFTSCGNFAATLVYSSPGARLLLCCWLIAGIRKRHRRPSTSLALLVFSFL